MLFRSETIDGVNAAINMTVQNVNQVLIDAASGAWQKKQVVAMGGALSGASNNASIGAITNGATVTTQAAYSGDTKPASSAYVDGQTKPYAADGGSVNAYTVSPPNCSITLSVELPVSFTTSNANTTSNPTLAYCGAAAKTITKLGALVLVAGDVAVSPYVNRAVYDGTEWVLQSPAKGNLLVSVRQLYTVTGGTGFLTPTITLLPSTLSTGMYVVQIHLSQVTIGNCTTSGAIRLTNNLTDLDSNFTSSPGAASNNYYLMANGAGISSAILTLDNFGTGLSLACVWSGIYPIYPATGTAVQIQVYQGTAASGGTCNSFATFEVTAQVIGPY